jgi:uncharacterized RmlC-like cupin family protein
MLLAFSMNAQAPVAVPIPKEPHHHLVFENSYVRVFRVNVPAHEATLLHQHDVPYLYVALGPADVINAVQDKPEVHLVMADGQLGYSPGHFAHIARNESDSPFNNVTFELLHAQGEVHNLCEKIVEGELGECRPFQNRSVSGKPYLRSEEMQVFSGTMKPKAEFSDIGIDDRLFVAMDQAEFEVKFPGAAGPHSPGQPTTRLSSGDVLWIPANRVATMANLRTKPSSYLDILFKDSVRPKKR